MISIITPHFNDVDGIKGIYQCLKRQSSNSWEWLIVDDLSDQSKKNALKEFVNSISGRQIKLILNAYKSNASVCRNVGLDKSSYTNVVFLDSDDKLSSDFIANRLIQVDEFVVFKNYEIVNENGKQFSSKLFTKDPLDCFLNANFIWQTTCVLWNKEFLKHIGGFDPQLERLQDVELSIRALFLGKNYRVLDNKTDFYYYTKPIRLKHDIVKKSCDSVSYLIEQINNNYTLSSYQKSLLPAYYFACVRCLPVSEKQKGIKYLKACLRIFYNTNFIDWKLVNIGELLLLIYGYGIISDSFFIKVNRYFFK